MNDRVVRAKADEFWAIEQIVNDRDKFLNQTMPLEQKQFFINYYRYWINFPNHYFFLRYIDDIPMSFRLFVIIPERPNECCIGVNWNKKHEDPKRRRQMQEKLATLDYGLDVMKNLNVDTFYRTHPIKNWNNVTPGRLANSGIFVTEEVEIIKAGEKPTDPAIAKWQYYDHTASVDQVLVKHTDISPQARPAPVKITAKQAKRLRDIKLPDGSETPTEND